VGKIHHYIGALTGALFLSACIPATTAPAPRASSVAHKAPASDFERGSLGEVVGGDARPTWTLQPVAANARIPAGRYHRVAAGETGIGIAHAYGVDWGEVVTINALAEPYILRVGQRLRLPASARPLTPEQVDVAARAAAFRLDIDDIVTGSQPALAAKTRPAAASAAPRAPVTTAIAPPAAFSDRFQWPLRGKLIARFGPLAPGKVNDGINIAAARGTPIHAAGGWMSAYGHAAKINVQRGQAVKAGEVIGLAGATGQVQSPQLHFQLRKNRIPVDPMKQLPPR